MSVLRGMGKTFSLSYQQLGIVANSWPPEPTAADEAWLKSQSFT